MTLGHKVEYFEVDYSDLEELVTRVYELTKDSWGRGWSFAADEESGNDISYTYNIDGKIVEYEEDLLKEFIESKKQTSHLARTILNDLARRGEIELGRYLILVSW